MGVIRDKTEPPPAPVRTRRKPPPPLPPPNLEAIQRQQAAIRGLSKSKALDAARRHLGPTAHLTHWQQQCAVALGWGAGERLIGYGESWGEALAMALALTTPGLIPGQATAGK